jgi:hypothetical protein
LEEKRNKALANV